MTDDPIYITRMEFRDICGTAEDLVIEPKPITVIYGTNGAGKSTIIKALRKFFQGGYDPTIVRKGADKGIIKITFSDGSYGERTINAKTRKSTIELYSATGEEMRPYQENVEKLAAGFSFDPLAFLTAKKGDRLEYLEQFLVSIQVTKEELEDACVEDEFVNMLDPSASAFTNIDKISDSAYQQRTKINGEAENLRGAVETLRSGAKTLNQDGIDWAKAEREAHDALVAVEKEHSAIASQVAAEAKASRDGAILAYQNASRAIEAEYLAALRAAEAQKEKRMAEAGEVKANAERAIAEAETKARNDIEAKQGAAVQSARGLHGAAKADLEAYIKASAAREQIKKMEADIAKKAGRALFLTNVLTRLKELRAEKQKFSPIPGLQIRTVIVKDKQEAEIFYGDVEFDGLNLGRRYELCIKLAELALRRCPLLIIDDAVNLVDSNWKAFIKSIRGSGIQIVAARLEEGDLRIETYEDVAA